MPISGSFSHNTFHSKVGSGQICLDQFVVFTHLLTRKVALRHTYSLEKLLCVTPTH